MLPIRKYIGATKMKSIKEKIREIRRRKKYTLTKLSELCGFSKGYLSKIERGRKVPPVSTLLAIARALEIDIAEFYDRNADASREHDIDISKCKERSGEGMKTSGGYAYQLLVKRLKGKYMSPFLVRITKGITDYFTHDSEEFLLVLEGTLKLWYDGKTYTLKEGDSAYFDSRKKHQFSNKGRKSALVLFVDYNYRRF
jgi:transcriptional regulator with XRE-family HTH domain